MEIRSLRSKGMGYKKIAATIGLSVNTIKSFCRNNKLNANISSTVCLTCGKKIIQMPKQKKKKFCSSKCREKWWNANRDKGDKSTGEKIICAYCGKEFLAYKHEHRKYCSHSCYVAERFKGGVGSDE